jgi:hypothetical protein
MNIIDKINEELFQSIGIDEFMLDWIGLYKKILRLVSTASFYYKSPGGNLKNHDSLYESKENKDNYWVKDTKIHIEIALETLKTKYDNIYSELVAGNCKWKNEAVKNNIKELIDQSKKDVKIKGLKEISLKINKEINKLENLLKNYNLLN